MGWLKRILQGSTSKSRQRSHRSCEVDDSHSSTDEPDDTEGKSTEGDETDYQMACIGSFSEDGQVDNVYGATSTQVWVQYEELKWEGEDERLAQSFQQSLAFESSSLWDIANIFQPFPYSFYPDNRQAFRHPDCFHSYASDGPLTDHEAHVCEDHSICQNIDRDHHLNHHHHRHHRPSPICYVCGQRIPVDENGRLLYGRHAFWRKKYCLMHEIDETPICWVCDRLKPRGSTYSTLSGGRWLCSDCGDSAVTESRALKTLERDVRKFYKCLGMKIHKRTIPLLLVNEQEMEKGKAQCQKNDHHRSNQTLGLTTWQLFPICTTVEGKDHILVAHTRNLTIRVLKGFPWLFTGHTLAHEMLHAWFTLEGYHNLDYEVEEGLCQVLAHMWLDSQLRSMSKWKIALSPGSDFQKSLAKFLQHDIESRTDHPYGTGFQKMKKATDMHGLSGTLNYIRMIESYPR